MSAGSRAATAATSGRAKQELVRLLFGQKYARKGPDAHRKLDHAIYSYSELRQSYYGTLQEIHPDKNKSLAISSFDLEKNKKFFNELQEAWEKYDNVAKMQTKFQNGDQAEANFTLFGVGCSFADNDFERAMRHEITEQASRGWFSSGAIAETSVHGSLSESNDILGSKVRLADDDMFVTAEETQDASIGKAKEESDGSFQDEIYSHSPPSLVANSIRHRRK
jgi:DnaJ-class molecular chaperone